MLIRLRARRRSVNGVRSLSATQQNLGRSAAPRISAERDDLGRAELSRLESLVKDNAELVLRAWHDYFAD